MMTNESRPRFPFSTLSALALAGLVVGCGAPETNQSTSTQTATASGPAQATSAKVDVCAFLTASDIERVLGTKPGEPKAGTDGLGECAWPGEGGSSPLVTLELSTTNLESYEAFVRSYQTEFGGEEPSPEYFHRVPDVGTWAMYVVDDGALRIYKGDRRLDVAPSPADEAKAIALGKLAAARLP